jgi:hypothetical protein
MTPAIPPHRTVVFTPAVDSSPHPTSAWRVRTSGKLRHLQARAPDLRTQVLALVHL